MRILHTQLGRHKCHLVGQSCALLARRVAFSIATIVWHTPLLLSLTVPLSHCPSSIALPGQPHSALLERNELNALPSTPPHFSSALFSSLLISLCPSVLLSVALSAHCHCQCHRRRHRHSSLCIFGVLFNTWTAHLNASTRLDWSPERSRARDELPRQLSIQSISIQSKLSESICLPSGIPPLPPSLTWHICCQSQRVIYAIIIRTGVRLRLRLGKQTNYLSSDSVFASPLSAPCKYFHSHSHSHTADATCTSPLAGFPPPRRVINY